MSQKVIEEHYSLAGQPFSVYTCPSDRISTYASYPWSSRYRPSCCRRHQCWLPRQQLDQSQTEHEEERFPIKWWYPSLQNSGIHLQAPRGWSPSGCSWSSPRPWVSLGSVSSVSVREASLRAPAPVGRYCRPALGPQQQCFLLFLLLYCELWRHYCNVNNRILAFSFFSPCSSAKNWIWIWRSIWDPIFHIPFPIGGIWV